MRKTVVREAAPSPAPPRLPVGTSERKVLVIGIDGLRWDRIGAASAPRLRELAATGMLGTGAHPRDSPARTMSGPGWSTLATGTEPVKHGVRRNSFAGRRFDRHPDFLTLATRIRPSLSTFVALDWPPLIERGLFGPEVSARVCFDGETYGYLGEDARVTDVAAALLTAQEPDAAFVYLGCVDYAGHQRGPLSDMYREMIGHADTMVGRLVDAVRSRPHYSRERWLILIGTDHGHRDRGGHGRRSVAERAIFVLAHGAGVSPGTARRDVRAVDVAPTALDHLGIVPPIEWALDGRSLLRST